MRRRVPAWLLAALLPALAATAQEPSASREAVRVTASGPGRAQIDRGRLAGIEPGDRVTLFPRNWPVVEGEVEALGERTAWVRLSDPDLILEIGVPGEVWIPAQRFGPEAPVSPELTVPERPPWERSEEGFDREQPLLKGMSRTRPEDREVLWSGRFYTSADWIRDSHGESRSYWFARGGLDLRVENPFGQGGRLRMDGELNYRKEDLPDETGESEARARLDRLSYAWGGTRQHESRWEAGRFLPVEFPQLGVLDGVEFTQRTSGGDRLGASVGFLPEPSADYATGKDLQAALFYRYVAGTYEELSAGAAFQKTWHEGDSDRDLLLLDFRYLPADGWQADGSAWIDFYGSEDVAKSASAELTELHASIAYAFERAGGWRLSASETRFPELLRLRVFDLPAAEIEENHTERVELSGWLASSDALRLSARVNLWEDEDNDGFGGEIRADFDGFLSENGGLGLTVFTQEGQFTSVTGVRADVHAHARSDSWRLSLESALVQPDGLEGPSDDLLQHAVRAFWDHRLGDGWSVSTRGGARLGDSQSSFDFGLFAQKRF